MEFNFDSCQLAEAVDTGERIFFHFRFPTRGYKVQLHFYSFIHYLIYLSLD